METSLKLVMSFRSQGDKTVNYTVDDPRDNLTEAEVIAAMNLLVEKNIFKPGGADLKECIKAKVVQTDTTEYDLKA
ncbi:MAG: DUF2922 domain-containing protein [Peptostreptococcaceae bacterium]